MEPTFAESSNFSEAVTAELRAFIDVAVAAILANHRYAPVDGEYVESGDAAFERLQD
jgi:hypothetical protein